MRRFSGRSARIGPADQRADVYWHRSTLWLIQSSVRTVAGFWLMWGDVRTLDAGADDEQLGATIRAVLDSAPERPIAHDVEPDQTPWSSVGRGHRSFCRATTLIKLRSRGESLTISPQENRMFIRPDPGFYPRRDLDRTLNDADDTQLGTAVRDAAQLLPPPL